MSFSSIPISFSKISNLSENSHFFSSKFICLFIEYPEYWIYEENIFISGIELLNISVKIEVLAIPITKGFQSKPLNSLCKSSIYSKNAILDKTASKISFLSPFNLPNFEINLSFTSLWKSLLKLNGSLLFKFFFKVSTNDRAVSTSSPSKFLWYKPVRFW